MPSSSDPADRLAALVADARTAVAGAELDGPGAVLLRDFWACASAGAGAVPEGGWRADGTAGVIALLAQRAHAHDRDDVDWATLSHPGSILWAVALGCGLTGRAALEATALGYEVMHRLGRILAPAMANWHLTALAGQPAAAVVAASALGLDEAAAVEAAALALSTAGVLAASVGARTNAGRLHRSGAAVGGLHAARAAAQGVRAADDLLGRPSGALTVFGDAGTAAAEVDGAGAGFRRGAVRVYPTNGFAQASVAAAAGLRARLGRPPTNARIAVPPAFVATVANAHPLSWWDGPTTIAAALVTGDPWCIADPAVRGSAEVRQLAARLDVQADAGLSRGASATAGDVTVTVPAAPGADLADTDLLRRKAEQLGTGIGEAAAQAAQAVLAGDASVVESLLVP